MILIFLVCVFGCSTGTTTPAAACDCPLNGWNLSLLSVDGGDGDPTPWRVAAVSISGDGRMYINIEGADVDGELVPAE